MLKPEIEDGQMSLADPAFRADVLAGLERSPRAIPARWFYDRKGPSCSRRSPTCPNIIRPGPRRRS